MNEEEFSTSTVRIFRCTENLRQNLTQNLTGYMWQQLILTTVITGLSKATLETEDIGYREAVMPVNELPVLQTQLRISFHYH